MNLKLDPTPQVFTNPSSLQLPIDQLHRPIHDLRISVIDQCNFRCTYCMPERGKNNPYTFLKEEEWLSFDEIVRLARLFVRCGVSKIRLTGGEPLLRPRLTDLIQLLRAIPNISDLALTTNGSLLAQNARDLKGAGLNRITVSLDTLNPDTFRKINGQRGNLQRILEGIEACEQSSFESIKINVVLQKNINDHEVLDLVRYFKNRKPILRFIEYMDVGNCNHWDSSRVVPSSQIIQTINALFPIQPIDGNYFGEVASRYKFSDGSGEVGFISSISHPFCRTCTRARLSTDGKIYTCLFASQGTDLRSLLRQNASDNQILDAIQSTWRKRSDRYSEIRSHIPPQSQHHPKVEMFHIGG